jgi:hypothetical protein
MKASDDKAAMKRIRSDEWRSDSESESEPAPAPAPDSGIGACVGISRGPRCWSPISDSALAGARATHSNKRERAARDYRGEHPALKSASAQRETVEESTGVEERERAARDRVLLPQRLSLPLLTATGSDSVLRVRLQRQAPIQTSDAGSEIRIRCRNRFRLRLRIRPPTGATPM